MHQLRPMHIAEGLQSLMPHHSSTARRVYSVLRDAYAEAIYNGVVDNNPVLNVRAPKHETIRKRLSLDVFKQMMVKAARHPQKWLRYLLSLAVLTGQRRADLAKMRFDDIVEDGGIKYLQVEQQKKAGKARGSRIRIPLNTRLDSIGLSLAEVISKCKTYATSGDFLLRKSNGTPIELSSLSARFHELIVSVCGPDAHSPRQWPGLHEVRSLSAREHRRQGTSVQVLLGHKHARMTDIYEDTRDLDDSSTWKVVSVLQSEPLPLVERCDSISEASSKIVALIPSPNRPQSLQKTSLARRSVTLVTRTGLVLNATMRVGLT